MDFRLLDYVWSNYFIWIIFCIASFLLLIVISFFMMKVGFSRQEKYSEIIKTHILNSAQAMLALTGFLIAISFGITEERFSQRRDLVLKEANAIGTTYLRGKSLPEPLNSRSSELLKEYAKIRIIPKDISDEELLELIKKSEELHGSLWENATKIPDTQLAPPYGSLYMSSLNELIDMHTERVTVGLDYRLPTSMIAAVFLSIMITIGALGLAYGIHGNRKALSALGPILLFWVLIIIIIDMDQPKQRFFNVSSNALTMTLNSMD